MIISKHPQGSTEWLQERAGIPTSSGFNMIVTTKGKPSDQRKKYLYSLVAERITGAKLDHYQSQVMERGLELESEARAMYGLITGNKVIEVGACFSDKRKLWASSPDGLIDDDGVLEIKCPLAHTHVGYLLNKTLPMAYYTQVQGQLLVTGREYADFMSYYPGLPLLCVRVKPDKGFLAALQVELELFTDELNELEKKLREI